MFSFGAAGGGAILFLTVTNREHPLYSDPPPRRSKLFPSPKLLGYAPAPFAQGETEQYCKVQDIIVSIHALLPGRFPTKGSRILYGRTLAVALAVFALATDRLRFLPGYDVSNFVCSRLGKPEIATR